MKIETRPPPATTPDAPRAAAPARAEAPEPPLTVVHVTAPARYGGLESVVRALAAGQAWRGHRVHVAAVLDRGAGAAHPLLAELRRSGVAVHPLEVAPRAYRRERAEIRALVERLAPDVVHTHGARPDVLHCAAARRAGAAAVATVHGFTGGGWKNRLYERLQRRALRGMDGVAAVSRAMAAALPASGVPAARIETIPNAWTPAAAPLPRAEARRALGLSAGELAIGWVGRVSPEKGLDVAIDALSLLAGIPARLVVLGDGPALPAMLRRARGSSAEGRVDFRGAVPQAGRWMTAFDAWVLSSRTEGTPVTLFEAIAAGVPVVASAVGGVPDVVGPAEALLVPPDDPEALASAILQVHRSPLDAADRARRAGERVAAAFAVEPWLDAYEQFYRRALLRARTAPRP